MIKPGKAARALALAAALGAFTVGGQANSLLYTFGGDFTSPAATGAPDSLNSMDPASAASAANVRTPVEDGSVGFNGGLVYSGGLLYGIGNDSSGVATLYSLQTTGLGLTAVSPSFNTSGDAAGVVFQNGLTAVGGRFYGIGAGATGEGLFQIGAGSATFVQSLSTLGGTYAGLAWDPALDSFYAIIAGANGPVFNGDYLVSFSPGGPVTVLANLTALDGADTGTHLGGLVDAGGGVLYDIFTNPVTFTGQLEQITVSGPISASTLYDTGIPLAQNAGIAAIAQTPEPSTGVEIGGGMVFVSWILKRRTRK